MLKAARSLPQGRQSVRHRARARPEDNVDTAGAIFQSFGADAGRCQGRHHGQVGQGAPGAGILQEAGAVPAAGRAGLGRRLQQQVADLRQGRADHEPAERLGGRQARRAAGRRAVLDPRHAVRARRAASRRSCRTSGASGTSARTSRRPRACCVHLSQRSAVEKMVAASAGYDLPVVREAHRRSRPGPRKGRPRARSTTIPTRTTTRSCRSRPRRRRRRSPIRSTPRRS